MCMPVLKCFSDAALLTLLALLPLFMQLSDLDRDGALDLDEFATAMFLARNAARDGVVPMQLPPNVVPPSKRRGTLNPF
jgi:hypothetical protein